MVKQMFLNLIQKYSADIDYDLTCWSEIKRAYTANNRHYHTLEHLESMLAELKNVQSEVKQLDTLLFAIFYHDIVYKAIRKDNEEQSAILFAQRIRSTSFADTTACQSMIRATKTHQRSADKDINLLLDLDLSILGKDENSYQEYCKNIKKEYRIFPSFLYRKGRFKILKNMLSLDSIYKTTHFKERYEAQARKNIRLELEQLS